MIQQTDSYSLYITGKLAPGLRPADVINNLKTKLSFSNNAIRALLENRASPIKKGLTEQQARLLAKKLGECGLFCRIEKISYEDVSKALVVTHPEPTTATNKDTSKNSSIRVNYHHILNKSLKALVLFGRGFVTLAILVCAVILTNYCKREHVVSIGIAILAIPLYLCIEHGMNIKRIRVHNTLKKGTFFQKLYSKRKFFSSVLYFISAYFMLLLLAISAKFWGYLEWILILPIFFVYILIKQRIESVVIEASIEWLSTSRAVYFSIIISSLVITVCALIISFMIPAEISPSIWDIDSGYGLPLIQLITWIQSITITIFGKICNSLGKLGGFLNIISTCLGVFASTSTLLAIYSSMELPYWNIVNTHYIEQQQPQKNTILTIYTEKIKEIIRILCIVAVGTLVIYGIMQITPSNLPSLTSLLLA